MSNNRKGSPVNTKGCRDDILETHLERNRFDKGSPGIPIGCALIILLCVLFLSGTSYSAVLYGIVIDSSDNPVRNAIVRVQGSTQATTSDSEGLFSLSIKSDSYGKYITAWSFGFYHGGSEISKKRSWYEIRLEQIPVYDNADYQWLASLRGSHIAPRTDAVEARPCQECHPTIVAQWRQDAHSQSAVNPLFHSFFYGTNTLAQAGYGPGYRLDFPNSNGNCATCHSPISALKNPFNIDPADLDPVGREGINCDFCHKISGSKVDLTGGRPGVLSYTFTRPAKGRQIFYGPLDDVFPGDDSCHPLYKQSAYCAPCHHGRFWTVLAYSEFQEWAESSYARKNIQCQDCHMKPDGVMRRFAEKSKGGVLRESSALASHINFGIKDVQFMKESISLDTEVSIAADRLHVVTVVKNVSAGHHYPTGNPMRNMILLVEVKDHNGVSLALMEGERLPEWAGVGPIERGNYANLPGRGYAKVLKDLLLYPDNARRRDFVFEYPAPHWRPTLIEYDSRIPANGVDTSAFQFEIAQGIASPIHITTRLIHRRAYKKWLDSKGFEIADLELANNRLTVMR